MLSFQKSDNKKVCFFNSNEKKMCFLNKSEKKKLIEYFSELIHDKISLDKTHNYKKRKYYLDDECVIINKLNKLKNNIILIEPYDINEVDIDKPLIDALLDMNYFDSNDIYFPMK